MRKILDEGIPKGILVNVNFPDCEPGRGRAASRSPSQGQRNQELLRIDERADGRGNPYFWIAFARGKHIAGQRHRPLGASPTGASR